MWTGAVIYAWHFTVHLSSGTSLCRCLLHLSGERRATYIRVHTYTHTYMYIHTYIHIYTHIFHGSISVSQRQYDVEQDISTQIYRILVSDTINILENSIIDHLCT